MIDRDDLLYLVTAVAVVCSMLALAVAMWSAF